MSNLKRCMDEAGFDSNESLARMVHELWSEYSPDEKLPTRRSLAVKLGILAKGELIWWAKRPVAYKALLQVLEVDPEDLPLSSDTGLAAGKRAFADFPQLNPLDLIKEKPLDFWSIVPEALERSTDTEPSSPFHWFVEEPYRGYKQATWVEVPPGGGKSFLVDWYAARPGFRGLSITTISAAEEAIMTPGRLVLEVHNWEEDADLPLLAEVGRRPDLLVLAPFPLPLPPHRKDLRFTPEYASAELVEQCASQIAWSWTQASWRAETNWRERLTKWAAARAPENTLLQPEPFLDWLQRVDPAARIFRTAGDLMVLLAWAHAHGEAKLRRRLRAPRDYVRLCTADRLPADKATPCSMWLKSAGAVAVEGMASALLFDLALPWSSALTPHDWSGLVPEESLMSDAFLGKPTAEGTSSQLRRTEAVSFLESAGVLQEAGEGWLALRPPWLERALTKGAAAKALKEHRTTDWGRLCMEPARRSQLVSTIDDLEDNLLLDLIGRAVVEFDPKEIGAVAAVEVLFSAVARRLERGWELGDCSLMHRLWDCMESSLVPASVGKFSVRSAKALPGLRGGPSEAIAWLADCWAWGLCLPAPPKCSGASPFLFPGWRDPPSEIGKFLRSFFASIPENAQEPDQLLRLQELAERLVAILPPKCNLTPMPDALQHISLLVAARHAGTVVSEVVLQALEKGGRLLQSAAKLPEEVQQNLAGLIWSALLDEVGPISRVEHDHDLAFFLRKHLRWEDMRNALRAKNTKANVRMLLLAASPSLRNQLAEWILEDSPGYAAAYLGLTGFLTKDDLPGLMAIAQLPQSYPRAHLEMWRLDASSATAAAEQALASADNAAMAWLWTCPAGKVTHLLDVIEARSASLSNELVGSIGLWAIWRLPDSGALAERLNKLAVACQGP